MFKVCSSCNIYLSVHAFSKNSTKKDWYSSKCKSCQRQYAKEHYKINKDIYKEKNKKNKLRNRNLYIDYMKWKCCSRCWFDNIYALQFHHLSDKFKWVSNLINEWYSVKRIFDEISKCEILCANCHAIQTAKDYNWYIV